MVERQSAIQALRLEVASGGAAPEVAHSVLPLEAIEIREEVFQLRQPHQWESESHVKELAVAIRRDNFAGFAPITVFWTGTSWVCIDGHHRLKALKSASPEAEVPVQVFHGTPDEALAESLRSNSRPKLDMSQAEKSGGAWQLVLHTKGLTQQQIADAANVSRKLVNEMHGAMREIQQKHPTQNPADLTWNQARSLAEHGKLKASEVGSDDWQRKQAEHIAAKLSKTFGSTLKSWGPEVLALALETYSTPLFRGLVDHLQEHPEDELPDGVEYPVF